MGFAQGEARSRIMRAIRSKNTAPEMAVRRYLHAAGYRFRLHRSDLPGKPDGNWEWRYRADQLDTLSRNSAAYLRELGDLYGRLPEPEAKAEP